LAVAGLPSSVSGQILSLPANPQFQNLFIQSGGFLNFGAGDITLTHSADALTLAGGDLDLASTYLTFTDTYISRDAANTILFGKDAAAPANYTLKAADATGAGPTAGASLSLQGGTPAGPGAYGHLFLQPSGGNVGIGTTGPTAPLTIVRNGSGFGTYGTLTLTNSSYEPTSGAEIRFQLGPTDATYRSAIRGFATVGYPTDGGTLQFLTAQHATGTLNARMTINSSGNVGVATTIPRYKNTTVGVLSSLLSDDGVNYEGLTITPATGAVTLATPTAGTGADNIDIVFAPAGTGAVDLGSTIAAGAASGTLLNSPVAGNATIYLRVKRGASYYAIPAWVLP
jgi:hypothetical protein